MHSENSDLDVPSNVRYWGQSGHGAALVTLSANDPKRTFTSPLLKRRYRVTIFSTMVLAVGWPSIFLAERFAGVLRLRAVEPLALIVGIEKPDRCADG
jgi:hypothetical protein